MRNLDISFIPEKYVFFWWLSKIIDHFEHLIISPKQVYIFGIPSWDMYRDHLILVKDDLGIMTMREYKHKSLTANIKSSGDYWIETE